MDYRWRTLGGAKGRGRFGFRGALKKAGPAKGPGGLIGQSALKTALFGILRMD
jgi:hypothetical protein